MGYPYTSPHDNPRFGPNPRDEIVHHCYGKNCEHDETLDEDNQEFCSEDENCPCSCNDCKEAVLQEANEDFGPEYDKYEVDEQYNEYVSR